MTTMIDYFLSVIFYIHNDWLIQQNKDETRR